MSMLIVCSLKVQYRNGQILTGGKSPAVKFLSVLMGQKYRTHYLKY